MSSFDTRTGEVVETSPVQSLVRVQNDVAPDLLKMIENRGALLERILDYAIKSTHPEQWFDLGGKPWPSGSACESMARRCGVSIINVQKLKRQSSDDRGDFYIWECSATFVLPSGYDSIEAFGTCASRDNFLGTDTGAGRELSEIDEGNIMKASYTNMLVNGITRLLGVRNLSWQRLEQLGLSRGAMGKVEYKSGSKGGGQQAAGGDLEIKFGKGKGKKLSELDDADLAYYLGRFEADVTDPEKAKFKTNAEKQVAAAKAEQARRANAKAGTEAKPTGPVTIWQRVQQLLGVAGIAPEKQGEWVKGVTGKTHPKELVEEDVAAVQTALAKEKAQAGGDGW